MSSIAKSGSSSSFGGDERSRHSAFESGMTDLGMGVFLTGWLEKEGHKAKNFKRRYFVLDGDSLAYYKEDINRGEPVGGLRLMGASVSLPKKARSGRPYCLRIDAKPPQKFKWTKLVVSFPSEAEMEIWEQSLHAAACQVQPDSSSQAATTDSSTRSHSSSVHYCALKEQKTPQAGDGFGIASTSGSSSSRSARVAMPCQGSAGTSEAIALQMALKGDDFELEGMIQGPIGIRSQTERKHFLLRNTNGSKFIAMLCKCEQGQQRLTGALETVAVVLSKLNHPRLFPVQKAKWVQVDQESQLLVSKEVSGAGSLFDIVHRADDPLAPTAVKVSLPPRKLPATKVMELAQQILEALLWLRACGIKYRHLHPGNVLCSASRDSFFLTDIENELLGLPSCVQPKEIQGNISMQFASLIFFAVKGKKLSMLRSLESQIQDDSIPEHVRSVLAAICLPGDDGSTLSLRGISQLPAFKCLGVDTKMKSPKSSGDAKDSLVNTAKAIKRLLQKNKVILTSKSKEMGSMKEAQPSSPGLAPLGPRSESSTSQ